MGKVHFTPRKTIAPSEYCRPSHDEVYAYYAKTNEEFKAACEAKGIAPTGRQYGKWVRGFGRARGLSRQGYPIDPDGRIL